MRTPHQARGVRTPADEREEVKHDHGMEHDPDHAGVTVARPELADEVDALTDQLTVTARDNVVTLTGTVRSTRDRDAGLDCCDAAVTQPARITQDV